MTSLSKRIFWAVFSVTLAFVLAGFGFAYWALTDTLQRESAQALADDTHLLKQALEADEGAFAAPASGGDVGAGAGDAGAPTSGTSDNAVVASSRLAPASTIAALGLGTANVRVTQIAPNGSVLYDSRGAQENHSDRPEVIAALSAGEGSATRYSETLGEVSLYHALKLSDGSVLRLATTQNHMLQILNALYLPALCIVLLMIAVALVVARQLARRLAAPLLTLNLDAPLDNRVYEELDPLLQRMEAQRQAIAAQVEEAARARRELTANVSHELKTPLTVISGYAELMKTGQVAASDVPYFSDLIYTEARHLQQLVEDVLVLAQLDELGASAAANTAEKVELVDLRALASDCIDRLAPFADQHNIRFHLEATGDAQVFGTRPTLESMLYNLCENAIRYNTEGGSVTVTLISTDTATELRVTDTGIGIAAEDQERIFERFYRVDKTHSRQTGGTGLGLAIVKHGALLHGADLQLLSSPGAGTSVTVSFPKAG
ncbi:MAG: two-component sensor histidine kinase [Coriobacteriales bacterium]|jgi:two-component system phosphate regulon sensor histidine kinase PhoR|nr:two-component sensor histidine kinase [Coriobacteriales bacterium]